ncbi:AraC family transcriptional regulator [Chryseobacterium sp. SSA4.19]|uniref:helix-turn-helix transcriptional regulator n=1 Tax=Chryseobacterium sp. SSA4.19 TaxID=2919915 RepID=UPI001F4DBC39|nr:AraC family transcriptional regulator [Chryseobacterium sp. SSA4.19]MCJ8154800.1 AraC family transcriptional regulator [Chryseobacterium sp. SSA4.19]
MKRASKKVVFSSEEIKIVIQDDPHPNKLSASFSIQSKANFDLIFLLSPDIYLIGTDCEKKFLFKKNQYFLHYCPSESHAELWTEHQETLKYFHIQINYNYIFNLINPEVSNENAEILASMVNNQYIFLNKLAPPYMTVEMHIILKEIISYSKKGMMQKLFVEAKIIKLLILIFEQFNEKNTLTAMPQTPLIIRRFVDENYQRNIKVEEIGKTIGINQNTIRKSFKAHYHMTVSDYMAELRMLKAKKLIINKEMMIKEIAIECGYEYVQNFSRAFKKKFGISPEKLRNE